MKYQLNPLLVEAKGVNFSRGSLSADFEVLRQLKAKTSRMSPQIQLQFDRMYRKAAADEIKKFKNLEMKKRAWRRELSKVDAKIQKFRKAHGYT